MKLIRLDAGSFGVAEKKVERRLKKLGPDEKLEVYIDGKLAYRVRNPTKRESEENPKWKSNQL